MTKQCSSCFELAPRPWRLWITAVVIICIKINININIERNSATIIVRLENGIQSLEDSLLNYTLTKNTNCVENDCNGNVETTRIFQEHIFVETDFLGDNEEIALIDFPPTIQIHNTRFNFYGVIAYGNDHYVSYIKRGETWENHNDIQRKINKFTEEKNKFVKPHMLIYIKHG